MTMRATAIDSAAVRLSASTSIPDNHDHAGPRDLYLPAIFFRSPHSCCLPRKFAYKATV
jgi:hypothetical protein